MQAARYLLYKFCNLNNDQTKIVHFRPKIRNLPYLNKNLLTCVQKEQDPPIIQIFFKCEYLFTLVLFGCLEQPELLTLPISFNFNSISDLWQETKREKN